MLEPAAIRQRIKKLGSANPAVRITALQELAKFTEWRAMVPMSCALLNDRSITVRTAAAKVLTNMHDRSVLTAMRVAAMIEPDAKQKKRYTQPSCCLYGSCQIVSASGLVKKISRSTNFKRRKTRKRNVFADSAHPRFIFKLLFDSGKIWHLCSRVRLESG